MKTITTVLMSLALVTASYAMDHMTLGITKVLDQPTRDSQEMTVKHGDTEKNVHVDRNIVLYDPDFRSMTLIEEGNISITILLTEDGSRKFSELTRESIGKRLAILTNNRLLSTPVVQQQITGDSIQIFGNMTKEEAEGIIALFEKAKKVEPSTNDCIEIKELQKKKEIRSKVSFANLVPLSLTPSLGDYVVGTSITIEKDKEVFSGVAITTKFEGFVEMADQKFSPLISSSMEKFHVPADGSWIRVKVSEDETYTIRLIQGNLSANK